MSKVFYIPGEPTAIDYALELTDGPTTTYVTNWTRETLDQLAQRYPGVVIGEEDSFIEQQERALSTQPEEIIEAEYHAAMSGPWPPLVWQLGDGVESFKGSEPVEENVTFIYARKGSRYWRFRGVATLPHPLIAQKIQHH
jgi:hypothetical protein